MVSYGERPGDRGAPQLLLLLHFTLSPTLSLPFLDGIVQLIPFTRSSSLACLMAVPCAAHPSP